LVASRAVQRGNPAGPAVLRRSAAAAPTPRPRAGRLAVGALVALALAVLAVAIRDPRYLLTRSFWLDEGWVVDSVRAPLHQLALLTSSTPIGWTLLLRLVPPVGGPERYRLLPLAFAALTALAAWRLGRLLSRGSGGLKPSPPEDRDRWSWLYGLGCGIAGAASVAVLEHTWLKQYTAEAFVAVALALLLARVERTWSWPALATYAAAGAAGFLVSNTAPLVSAAGLGGLWLVTLAARRWSRLPALAATTAVLGLADLVIYQALANNGGNLALRRYWQPQYLSLDDGLGHAAHLVGQRLAAELGSLGWGPWWLALALIGVGLVTMWRAGLPALALAVPAVGAELVVLGFAGAYPFLERRTAIFYAALLTVTAAAGLATLVRLGLAHRATAPLAVAGLVVAGVLLAPGWVRAGRGDIPGEDVKAQVADVLARGRPGDPVLVTFAASFSFAYYWPDRPTFVPTPTSVPTAVGFMPTFPGRPELVLVHQPRSLGAMAEGLERALRLGRGRALVVTGSPDELAALRHQAPGVRFVARPGRATLAVATDTGGLPSHRSRQRRWA
jgi:hypothetical protein